MVLLVCDMSINCANVRTTTSRRTIKTTRRKLNRNWKTALNEIKEGRKKIPQKKHTNIINTPLNADLWCMNYQKQVHHRHWFKLFLSFVNARESSQSQTERSTNKKYIFFCWKKSQILSWESIVLDRVSFKVHRYMTSYLLDHKHASVSLTTLRLLSKHFYLIN